MKRPLHWTPSSLVSGDRNLIFGGLARVYYAWNVAARTFGFRAGSLESVGTLWVM